MRNEVQNDAAAAYREVTGTASPVPPPSQPASGQSEQASDRYAITPDKEQYIRKVMQIAADEKASNVPDVDERMMRLRERVALEEKDSSREPQGGCGGTESVPSSGRNHVGLDTRGIGCLVRQEAGDHKRSFCAVS